MNEAYPDRVDRYLAPDQFKVRLTWKGSKVGQAMPLSPSFRVSKSLSKENVIPELKEAFIKAGLCVGIIWAVNGIEPISITQAVNGLAGFAAGCLIYRLVSPPLVNSLSLHQETEFRAQGQNPSGTKAPSVDVQVRQKGQKRPLSEDDVKDLRQWAKGKIEALDQEVKGVLETSQVFSAHQKSLLQEWTTFKGLVEQATPTQKLVPWIELVEKLEEVGSTLTTVANLRTTASPKAKVASL